MAKKYLLLLLLVTALAIGGALVAYAEDNTSATTNATTTPPILGSKKLDLACMRSAIEKRETALVVALDVFASSTKAAWQVRKDALLTAWQIEKIRDRALAIAKAHKDFQRAKIAAKNAYNKTRVAVWRQFTTERKACGASPTGENMNNDTL